MMNSEWKKVKLGEVLTSVQRMEKVDAAKSYRLLGIRLDGQGPFLRETVTGGQTSAPRLFRVAAGDFIYSRLFACRGAFGVIGDDLDGCYVSGEFPTFRPKEGKIDIQFLKYWFRLPSVIAAVDADCSGSTPLTRNRFKENFFSALEIPLPPLAEQQRIVARIEELAYQIEEARTLRNQEEQELRQMLLSAFWRIAKDAPRDIMGNVAPLVRRPVHVQAESSYPELGLRSFGKGTFHKPTLSGLDLGDKRVFSIEPGDLLFSNVFAWEGAIAIAQPEDANRIGSHRYMSCVVDLKRAIAPFLCFYFLTQEGLGLIGSASPGGAGRNRTLGIEALSKILVPVPSLKDQQWFNALLSEVNSLKRLHTETAADLDALLPVLLDRAFKGEL